MAVSVAPHAGAWIETTTVAFTMVCATSLPTRERGLKHFNGKDFELDPMSLPTRERGLKPERQRVALCVIGSLPTRERGLKQSIGF